MSVWRKKAGIRSDAQKMDVMFSSKQQMFRNLLAWMIFNGELHSMIESSQHL